MKILFILVFILKVLIPEFQPLKNNIFFLLVFWIMLLNCSLFRSLNLKYSQLLFSLILISLLFFPGINIFSYQELITFFLYLTVFILSYNLLSQKEFIKVMQFIGVIVCIYSLVQIFYIIPFLKTKIAQSGVIYIHHLNYILNKERIFGLFLTSNSLGIFLVFLLPLLFYSLPPIIKLFYFMLAFFILYSTRSMGAYFALSCIVIIAGIYIKKFKKISIFVFSICLLSLILIIFQRRELLFNSNNLYFNPFYQRFQIWDKTLRFIIASPLKGSGLGKFSLYYNMNLPQTLNQVLYAHNIFIQFWFESGILGLIWVLSLYYLAFKKARKLFFKLKGEGVYIALGCLGFLIHNLIDFTFYLPQIGIIFWAGLAQFLKESDKESKKLQII